MACLPVCCAALRRRPAAFASCQMRLIVLRKGGAPLVVSLLPHALIRMPTRRFWCSNVSRRSNGALRVRRRSELASCKTLAHFTI